MDKNNQSRRWLCKSSHKSRVRASGGRVTRFNNKVFIFKKRLQRIKNQTSFFFFGFFLTGRDEGCIDLVPNVIGTWELCDDEATHVVECRLKQKSTTTITQQLWEEKSLSVWFECFDLCIVWCASRSSQSSGSARPKGRPDINGPTSLGQITWQKRIRESCCWPVWRKQNNKKEM